MFTQYFFWKFYAKSNAKNHIILCEKGVTCFFNKFKVQIKFLSVSTIKVK